MSHPSTKGRQERRGPHTASALPGRSAAARARSLQRTRAAARSSPPTAAACSRRASRAERERTCSAPTRCFCGSSRPPTRRGCCGVAQAALAVAEDSHLTQLKSPASDSRPPEFRHNGTPATDGSPPRSETRTGHAAGESAAHRIAAREGEGSTPSSRPKSPRAPYKLTGPTRAAVTELKAPASDSRPPGLEAGHNGTPFTDGSEAPSALDYPPEPPRDFPRGPMARAHLRPTNVSSPGTHFAPREGEVAALPSTQATEDAAARSVRGGDRGVRGRSGAGSETHFPPAITTSGRGLVPSHNANSYIQHFNHRQRSSRPAA